MCKVGIVLSGGMARGAYQVGALKAINEYFPPEDVLFISASSIGVLNSYAYATRKLEYLEQKWRESACDDKNIFIAKIVKSAFLQKAIDNLVDESDALPKYFYETLYSINDNSLKYVNLSDIPAENRMRYLKAGVAIPIYNKPVYIDGDRFFDGAIIDNIPIYPLQKLSVDYIICSYFDDCNYIFENQIFNNRIIKLIFSDKSMLRNSLCFDKNTIDIMLHSGYRKTKEILDQIMSHGTDDLDFIYNSIGIYNDMNSKHKFRITGDMIVTNCNKIAHKLIKRQVI